ncbi:BQ5605_C012g07037 [Microbotryum silenes-dioicae]|uniref:Actin-related protein 2/3 complex subunit n=1 Tax=Microbotryum silenes-dioicae TaxID=796604 RepID=A0A2X0ME90_9BASI|nr:BQ5605_C012g07037 [Microbotryum silenes-dioicae]
MSLAQVEVLVPGTPITAHAFNADRTQLAISANSNQVRIYAQGNKGWQLTSTLSEHDKLVTSIDWAPHSNRIVTCSHDRNAYVYTNTHGAWTPTLVVLRLNRSATCVRWSPTEDKFAVASGARSIAICHYDQESDWWVAKHIKKPLRTTVLSLEWHPNSVLLAAGSADGVARVFSAWMKGIDSKPEPSVWGERLPFNTVCGEFASPAGGWVHGVAFSPSGDALAFVCKHRLGPTAHDSTLTVVYPTGADQTPRAVYAVQLASLPLLSLVFTSEGSIVAAGHDCEPMLFEGSVDGGWAQTRSLDDPDKRSGGSAVAARSGRLAQSEAFNVFRQADSRGVSSSAAAGSVASPGTRLTATGTELLTVHQNTITSVRKYDYEGAMVSTTGVDGRLALWNVHGEVGSVTRAMGRMGV